FAAAATLKQAGLRVVITVSPLLPLEAPRKFFQTVAKAAAAVVLDHFIQGDGTPDGTRTLKTELPKAMTSIDSASTSLSYRDQMVSIAQEVMPGQVGVSVDGFAGRFLST
ncbi:MAG TPA: hypothetical protein VIH59_20625, partial [Candidatus Tectomicrobia bacterium]